MCKIVIWLLIGLTTITMSLVWWLIVQCKRWRKMAKMQLCAQRLLASQLKDLAEDWRAKMALKGSDVESSRSQKEDGGPP